MTSFALQRLTQFLLHGHDVIPPTKIPNTKANNDRQCTTTQIQGIHACKDTSTTELQYMMNRTKDKERRAVESMLIRLIRVVAVAGLLTLPVITDTNAFHFPNENVGWRTPTKTVPSRYAPQQQHPHLQHRYFMSSDKTESVTATTTTTNTNVDVPLTLDAMIKQATTAMREAANAGYTRQIVRILLPRDKNNADLGRYFESDVDTSSYRSTNNENIVLCPTDESWQGGIMQLYRSAAPTAQQMVRALSNDVAGVPLRIVEDRTIDESGVDGIGLIATSDQSIVCYVQPTQEIVDEYVNAAVQQTQEKLLVLLNPQWRQVNDALDEASTSNTNPFLSSLASFLGGKGNTLKRIKEAGYTPVYTLEGYVCRGANVRLLQMGYNNTAYNVYVERDDYESYLPIGTCPERPTYQQVDTMLQNANIGYKYARDIGLQPKL
jgi:Domain of unknown function (DUF1995)